MTAAGETFGDIVRRVAADFGQSPTPTEIDHILWEHTGFPGFWAGDPASRCEAQVRTFYEAQDGSTPGGPS